jgi:polyisoprenoid-binding protein YceI
MTTATALPIAAGTYAADTIHSVVNFKVRHFGITWLRGGFSNFDIKLVAGEDGALALEGSTPVQDIEFPNEQLHGHLMSPDFFDAELHPTLSFASQDVTLADDGAATVHGQLTMRGVTKDVTLVGTWSGPVEDMGGAQRIGLELAGEVDRNDFGIAWAAKLAGGQDVLGRTVRIEGEFELARI